LEDQTFIALQKTADALGQEAGQLLKANGLTGAQYNVLRILRGSEPAGLACNDIGERMISHDPDMTRLLDRTGNVLPFNFVVTLPKITSPEHVAALVSACRCFEYWRGLPDAPLRIEVMVETTQAIFAEDGLVALPRLIEEGCGRIVAAHFGTYDYTAACGIIAAHQHMLHPACDFAKHVMQVALAGTGIWVSDGATNILPIEPHRASPDASLTPAQREENRRAVPCGVHPYIRASSNTRVPTPCPN